MRAQRGGLDWPGGHFAARLEALHVRIIDDSSMYVLPSADSGPVRQHMATELREWLAQQCSVTLRRVYIDLGWLRPYRLTKPEIDPLVDDVCAAFAAAVPNHRPGVHVHLRAPRSTPTLGARLTAVRRPLVRISWHANAHGPHRYPPDDDAVFDPALELNWAQWGVTEA